MKKDLLRNQVHGLETMNWLYLRCAAAHKVAPDFPPTVTTPCFPPVFLGAMAPAEQASVLKIGLSILIYSFCSGSMLLVNKLTLHW